jgi:hypothetical protein
MYAYGTTMVNRARLAQYPPRYRWFSNHKRPNMGPIFAIHRCGARIVTAMLTDS